jgi:hypothetical protein
MFYTRSTLGLSPKLREVVSLRAVNSPERYIRHRGFLGFIEPVNSELARQDASFRIVPGLANSNCKSFESVNAPNHFLRHEQFRLKLSPRVEQQLFKDDATFCIVPGLGNSNASSFESVNAPGHYIRHRNFELWLDRVDGTDLFKADATFNITSVPSALTNRSFPLRGSQFTELGEHRRMETSITISNNGRIDGVTRTWTANKWKGFTGAVAVVITDSAGNVLHVTPPQSYGVDCRRCPNSSDRTQQWSNTVPSNVLNQVGGYAIVHTTNPRNRWRDWLATAKEAATEIKATYRQFGN